MKKIEFELTRKFMDYMCNNDGRINAHKVVTELLKKDGISKPQDLKVQFCSIADLKYQGHEIVGASISSLNSMYNGNGKIYLEVK